jgi:hypothetical protein
MSTLRVERQKDLFHLALDSFIDLNHLSVLLAQRFDWASHRSQPAGALVPSG